MSIKAKRIIVFLGILFVSFLATEESLALEVTDYPTTLSGQSLNSTSSLADYVCYLFDLFTELAVSLTIIVIAYGGINYLISYGRGKFTSSAKEWMKAGILGLLLVVCSTSIIYTINPNLTNCKLGALSFLDFSPSSDTTSNQNINTITYQEIPLGKLTETLLTRTMDCYGFDMEGNPINGSKITNKDCKTNKDCLSTEQCNTNAKKCATITPTYLGYDRADCLVKMVEGAQKKSGVAAELSNKITILSQQCSCEGKCNPTCDPNNGGCATYPGGWSFGFNAQCSGSCSGSCVGGACEQPESTTDCCPDGVKEEIEHGQPETTDNKTTCTNDNQCTSSQFCDVDSNVCKNKNSHGLDEFRCPNPIKDAPLTSCDIGDIRDFVEEEIETDSVSYTIINKSHWFNLNLRQQLIYFKNEIEDQNKKIENDKAEMVKAKYALSECYLAIPYIDLLKSVETTDKNNEIILTEKVFSDPQTKEKIDATKYCDGFNYDNSSCLKKCNDMCPNTGKDVIGAYKLCYESATEAAGEDEKISDEEILNCVKDAYNERSCEYAPKSGENGEETAPADFKECVNTCQDDCTAECQKEYSSDSGEYNVCVNQCSSNGRCVLDNIDKCLLDPSNVATCATDATVDEEGKNIDQGNIDYCMNTAYLCKNGSNQYAGYQDCANNPESVSENYSASYFYDTLKPESSANREASLKCSEPYETPDTNSACYTGESDDTCRDLCPETQKCPTDSKCEKCTCDQINQTANFAVPNESTKNNAGYEGYGTSTKTIISNTMAGPQCNEYSFNDDPLTFYCESSPKWWDDLKREGTSSTPLGEEKICPLEKEVPVGQTVDSAETWADSLIKTTKNLISDIQTILDQMETIGTAIKTDPVKDYCKCEAKLEDSSPICKTGCSYNSWVNCNNYGCWRECSCTFIPCKGQPCEQMIDYLSEFWNDYRKFKLDYIDFFATMTTEPRSDILKKLTYSRQTTNSCSLTNSIYGANSRLLSCTRVEDELIYPINMGEYAYGTETIDNYCYGTALGKLSNKSLTDNWFCCDEYSPEPEQNINTIYNVE